MALLGPNGSRDNQTGNHDSLHGRLEKVGDDCNNILFDKLEIQAIEAAEQCERLGIPIITSFPFALPNDNSQQKIWDIQNILKEWCHDWEESQHLNRDGEDAVAKTGGRTLLVCRERASTGNTVVPVLQALQENQRVVFLVGPEGGWSTEEEKMIDEISSKYSGKKGSPVLCVSLGERVLRAETACLLAIGAWALSAQ